MSQNIYQSENSEVVVIEEGHKYQVITKNNFGLTITPIIFQNGAVKEVGGRNGLQNEELLAILIDRLEFLDKKFPCQENTLAIYRLKTALDVLESRTRNRKERGVEGKDIA